MIICEYEFEDEDINNPGYSHTEIDYYAWIPQGSGMPNHRLSLRKNLKTQEYEIYRHYYEQHLISRGPVTIITGADTGVEDVAFSSKDLTETIKFADGEWRRFHGEEKWQDQVCKHRPPVVAHNCKKWESLTPEERLKIYGELKETHTESQSR